MQNYLNYIPVKPGDFMVIPAGSIHAIGKGVTLCEIQQKSGVTYRVWDWNRAGLDGKPRELHIKEAKEVTNFNEDFNQNLISTIKTKLFEKSQIINLYEHNDFKVQLFSKLDEKPFLYSNTKSTEQNKEDKYILLVNWETIEDHEIGFRKSDEYQEWKALLHHFYEPFPTVEHYR